jgi:lysophospholipase L1-like esterase
MRKVQSSGFQVRGFKFRVSNFKFRVQSSEFWIFSILPFFSSNVPFGDERSGGVREMLKAEKSFQSHGSRLKAHSFFYILLFLLAFGNRVNAQYESYLYHVNQHDFIRYDLNELNHFGADKYSTRFYDKLEQIVRTGEGRINVVQIGGSHIQAGTFSGQIRSRLQQMNGEMNAGWGYMFPYRISRTNSPFGYYIRYNGKWQSCRNIEKRKTSNLGVGGISATTSAPKAELTILLEDENKLNYSFNKLRVFYENSGVNYMVSVDTTILKKSIKTADYFELELNSHVDSLKITIQKESNSKGSFTLHGITSEVAPNGIMYHSIGVNGAHVPAFLRCQLFEKQLADLKPDLVILGLGINDAYGRRFSQNKFEDNYGELIQKIRKAAPETAIIFTTNNDSYLYRRYVNKNGEKVQQSMFRMAKKYQAGVWDMYSVMGGLNSIVLWEKNNLAQHDKIHFTREGYLTLGDLFFNALIQGFENYIESKNQITELNN